MRFSFRPSGSVKAILGTGLEGLEGNGEDTDWFFAGSGGGRSASGDARGDPVGSPRPMGELKMPLASRGVLDERLDRELSRLLPLSSSAINTAKADDDLAL